MTAGDTLPIDYKDSVVRNEVTYSYVVTAVDAEGESADADEVKARPIVPERPTESAVPSSTLFAKPFYSCAHNLYVATNGNVNYFSCDENKCNTNPLLVDPSSGNFALEKKSPGIGYDLKQAELPNYSVDVGACAGIFTQCT